MRYELTATGRKELAEPDTWARNKNTVTLVKMVEKGVSEEALNPKQKARLNSWAKLGWVKKSEVVRSAALREAKPKKATTPKAA